MTRPTPGRELYVAAWPITDDTRKLHVLQAEAVPRLDARIRKAGCILADSPAWAICADCEDLPAKAHALAASIGVTCAALPAAFANPRVRPTLLVAAPVLRALSPTAIDPMPAMSDKVREYNRCGWSTAQIAERMRVAPERVDLVRAACRIAYPLGTDGL